MVNLLSSLIHMYDFAHLRFFLVCPPACLVEPRDALYGYLPHPVPKALEPWVHLLQLLLLLLYKLLDNLNTEHAPLDFL